MLQFSGLATSGSFPAELFTRDRPHPLDPQIFEAIARHDLSHLQALFAAGARPNAISPETGKTALAVAAEQGQQKVIQCLIDQGAEVNDVGSQGETPLMAAASAGNLELVSLLLDQGARVGAMSDDGDTALCLAAGATRWVAMAPEEAQQAHGITRQTAVGLEQLCPQDEAVVIRVVETLLAAGAQLNRGGCSSTPLMEAARYGQLKLLAVLLQRGAEPELTAKDGQNALAIAKLYNQARALTLLEAQLKSEHGGDDAKPIESAA